MSEHKDGVVLHDREFVPDHEMWADYLCSDCGEYRGRQPVGELCRGCFDERHRMLEALGIGIAAAAECEIQTERCGWERRHCLRCGRTMPEVQLKPDYDGYECADNGDCWREIQAAREQAEQERRKKAACYECGASVDEVALVVSSDGYWDCADEVVCARRCRKASEQ